MHKSNIHVPPQKDITSYPFPETFVCYKSEVYATLRDRGSLLFLLGERRKEPLLATARFFDLTAVHGQGRINLKKPAFDNFKTGFEFAHGRHESKHWLKTLTRAWKCTRCIMQMGYLYASDFPFKNSCKLSRHATLHKWCGRNCCLMLNLRCKSNSIWKLSVYRLLLVF